MFRFINMTVVSFTTALVIFAFIPTVYAITTVTKFKTDHEQKIVDNKYLVTIIE